jgi:uncharacterized protein
MKKIILIFILLLFIPVVSAKQASMKLLAVRETSKGYEGSPADLYLEIKQGSGRVFLDTFPLTKLDTQISTRFAKEIACGYINADCDRFDFIYTIKAGSTIIGGPSAGAAITALTIALLKGFEINKGVTVSGTINSGGLIGPVGELKAKIDAGSKAGIKKILVPLGSVVEKEINNSIKKGNLTKNDNLTKAKNNLTIDLIEYGKEKGVEIKEVLTINDVVYELTGVRLREIKGELIGDEDYKSTMRELAVMLCNRSSMFYDKVKDIEFDNKTGLDMTKENAINLSIRGKDAFDKKLFYSSASYCFGSNVKFNYIYLMSLNLSQKQILDKIYLMKNKLNNFSSFIKNKEILTITDLESYMVVKERLTEAKEFLDKSWFTLNESKSALSNLAYATERIFSAYSWAYFFDHRGKKFKFNNEILRNSCLKKIAEVEERYQYLILQFPFRLEETRKELNYAYSDLENKDYELCLFKASKAKASVDILLNLMGIEEKNVIELVKQKLNITKKVIIRDIQKDIFPVLGYSYYEYSNELKDSDKYSALLYSEYALELSNLDMYFKERDNLLLFNINKKDVLLILIWISVGILIGVLATRRKNKI